eukprot:Platyproteum_vivax@DN187_c0_g1_i3.p1
MNQMQMQQMQPMANQMGMGQMGQMGQMMPQMGMMMPLDGYSIIANLPKVLIKEKMKLLEVLTDIEMNNAYSICTMEGAELFVANENSTCCERNCCLKDCGPFRFDISMIQGPGMPRVNLWHAERPCTCTCCCFNRPKLHITDCLSGNTLATLIDPFACCNLTFNIEDASGERLLRANGGCCQWGLCCPCPCGPCAKVLFKIEDAKSGDEIGTITKVVPGCCKFLISDADNYEVEFGAISNPQWKAIVICLAIFMDFRYFDNRNEDDDKNSATINIT